ncbi:MAG: AAA+ family ATPase [Tabrizicola sp.]|nr:AAA+ family ATPase [Tabrizicola sp.]
MRLVLAICLAAAPAFAEDAPAAPEAESEGFSLMEEGMKLVLRGMMDEMQPAFDELEAALEEMKPGLRELAPKLRQILALIDDAKNYDAPVMLPNGDILIRRNAPLPPKREVVPGPNGEIEL